MANNILNTKSLIEELNAVWIKHAGILDQTSESYQRVMSSAKLPSNYVKAIKEREQNTVALKKSEEQLIRTQQKAQRQRLQDLKLYAKREKAFDKYERQLEREQRRLERTQGLYNKVQRGINSVTREYNDLALKRELNGKLTDKETIKLGQLEAKINKYQNALKRVDSNIGKYQRNVGNYGSAFNGLGFSIAQISREMPAFANSLQTGFMAISNNLPMLFDEIQKITIANKELAASGKPTTSVLKQLGRGIFSLQSLLSIGVTLLTVYGAKLIESLDPTSKAEKATKKYNDQLKEQNKQLRENIQLRKNELQDVKSFVNDPNIRKAFENVFKDLGSEEANLALIELSERLEKIGVENAKALKNQNIGQADRLTIAGNLFAIEEQRIKLEEERSKLDKRRRKAKEVEEQYDRGEIQAYQLRNKLSAIGVISLDKTLKIQGRINQLEKENELIIKKGVELTTDKGKGTEDVTKELEKTVEIIKKEIVLLSDSNVQLEEGLDYVKQQNEAYERQQAIIRRLRNQTEQYLSSFIDDVGANNPLSNFLVFANGMFDQLLAGADTSAEKFGVYFNTIAESAEQAFNFISQIGQANFEEQYRRLEQQRDIAIQFAGDSTTAQAEIERQYEERRRQIANRQAKAQKDQAIFGATINTAQGVTAALTSTPPNIPLSIIVGALGAAQIALIASQQVPQFWQGGEVGSSKIMVNDDPLGVKGSNYKEVVREPSGKLHFPKGKNVKMTVPKGSYVYPTYDAFINSLDQNLISNNIMPIGQSNIMPMIINNGLNKGDIKEVFSQEIGKLNSTIKNRKGVQIINDRYGQRVYEINQNKKTRVLNARYSGKGLDV